MVLYVVTGASRGLGWSLVKAVAARGHAVLALSRSGLPHAVDGCEDVRCDLGTAEGRRTAAEAISRKVAERAWTRAVLFNNAGMVEPVGPLERLDGEALARNLDLNLVAPVVLMQAFAAATADMSGCSIVNISSGAGRRPVYGWTAYCSAKAGLDMASQVVALEAERRGRPLRVTSLAPGTMDTAMQGVVRSFDEEAFPEVGRFRTLHENGRLPKPDDVAAKILRLEETGELPAGLANLADL